MQYWEDQRDNAMNQPESAKHSTERRRLEAILAKMPHPEEVIKAVNSFDMHTPSGQYLKAERIKDRYDQASKAGATSTDPAIRFDQEYYRLRSVLENARSRRRIEQRRAAAAKVSSKQPLCELLHGQGRKASAA